jgi:integrase
MKGRRGKKRDHIVVLAPQAVEVFRAARAASPDTALVFPGVVHHTQPIAESTLDEMLGKVLRAAKQDGAHTIHGWRSCFSTIMNERHELQHRETVDLMLAHKAFEATEGLYNRATVLARRRALATEWAEALLVGAPDAFTLIGLGDLRPATVTPPTAPSNVVKLPRKAA